MKVSIIVPVYNVAPYIIRCLDSINRQTFSNLECIIVDDCGTDNSIQLAKNYIKNVPFKYSYRIIHHKYNQGISEARNTGINMATGDYIFFIDSDDAITPNCIETLANLANKYPFADIIQGNTVTGSEDLMPHCYKYTVPEYCDDKEALEELLLSTTLTTPWNKLIRTTFIRKYSLYFPKGIVMEDTYWSYFLTKKTKSAAFTNEQTYYYYKNGNSIIHGKSKIMNKKRVIGLITGVTAFYEDMRREGRSTRQQRMYLFSNMVICLSKLSSCLNMSLWFSFWKLTNCIFVFHPITKVSFYSITLYLLMMPPLCFFAYIKGWGWRINHYISCKL